MSRNIRSRSVTDGGVVMKSAPTSTDATSQSGVSGATGRTNPTMARNTVKRSIQDGETTFTTKDSSGAEVSSSSAAGLRTAVKTRNEAIIAAAKKAAADKAAAKKAEAEKRARAAAEKAEAERVATAAAEKAAAEQAAQDAADAAAKAAADEKAALDLLAKAGEEIIAAQENANRAEGDDYNDQPFTLAMFNPDDKDFERDWEYKVTFGNAKNFSDFMRHSEDSVYQIGAIMTMPKMPRKVMARGHMLMAAADLSRAIRRGNPDEIWAAMNPTKRARDGLTPNANFDMDGNFSVTEGGGDQWSNRLLNSFNIGAAFASGDLGDTGRYPGAAGASKGENEPLLSGIGNAIARVPSKWFALSEFENEQHRIRSLHGIRTIEEDRYFTVMYHPASGITYVEWKPTEDIRNYRTNTQAVGREWSEDFIASLGLRIPAWSKRVKYIKDKYGLESETTKHYGYSRGGGMATHMGGVGYGTGYFSSYLPAKTSRSKFSGDKLHDYVINPLSYGLMFRNILRS
uniref:Uncharacterized protein n=1 Tax=viral metagenome TaxID=1070528 RepID=A0A2V0RJI9_9ZZZZ